MPHFQRRITSPLVTGGYAAYRSYVREDFRGTCAYCLLGEVLAGGPENFELDHFRPRALFPDRVNDFYNLYYSCHVCNRIKQDQWPGPELTTKSIGFVDLCADTFEAHFEEGLNGVWSGRTDSGRFTIDALRLNRPHLVQLRFLLRSLSLRNA